MSFGKKEIGLGVGLSAAGAATAYVSGQSGYASVGVSLAVSLLLLGLIAALRPARQKTATS